MSYDLDSIFGKPNNDNVNKQLDNIFGKPDNANGLITHNGNTDYANLSGGFYTGDLDSPGAKEPWKPEGTVDNYVGNAAKGFTSGMANVVGGIADFVHADTLGDAMNKVANDNQRGKNFDSIYSLDYLTSPDGLTYDTSNMIGSMAGLAPAAYLAPDGLVATGVGGTTKLLSGLGSKKLAQWATGEVGQKALALGVRGAMTSPLEAGSEAGNVRRDANELGLDNPDARAWQVFGENMLTLPASNALEYMLLGGKLFKPAAKAGENFGVRALKAPFRAAPAVAANATQNGVEELLQQTFQDAAEDKQVGNVFNPYSWTDAQRQAFEVGLAGSAVLGGAASGYRSMRAANDTSIDTGATNVEMPDNLQSIIDTANQSAEQQTLNQANANLPNLSIANNVEDNDLSHTNTNLVDRVKVLNNWATDNLGQGITVTSGWRSPENNAASNGAEHSHHLDGNAMDISTEGLNDDQRQALFQKAGELGFNTDPDIIYHDKGSGYHMHLQFADNDQNSNSGATGNMSKEDFFNTVSGQESGGNYEAENGRTGAFGKYQIMPGNWSSWSQEAGLPEGTEMTPENQEIVARYKLGDYYDKYGPEGALVAWYSGENNAQRWVDGKETALGENGEYSWDAKQGAGNEPSVREYVQQSLGRAGQQGKGRSSGNSEMPMFNINDGKIIDFAGDFADYMRSTSSDPETINFFEDKFNSKNKFIDTPENRKEIEEKYGNELKKYAEEKQNSTPLDEVPGQSLQESKTAAVSKPIVPLANSVNVPQIDVKNNALEIAKQRAIQSNVVQQNAPLINSPADELAMRQSVNAVKNNQNKLQQALDDPKMKALADRALAGDKSAVKGLNIVSQPVRDALMQSAHERVSQNGQQPERPTLSNNINAQMKSNKNDPISAVHSYTAALAQDVSQGKITPAQANEMINSSVNNLVNSGKIETRLADDLIKESATTLSNTNTTQQGGHLSEKSNNTKTTLSQDTTNQNVNNILEPSQTTAKESEVNFNNNHEQALAALPDKQLNKIAKTLGVKKAGTKSREGFVEKIASRPVSEVRAAYNKALGIKEDTNAQSSQDISKKEPIQEETHQEEITKPTKDSERFGNEDEAASDMLKAFGIEKPAEASKQKAFNVIDDSDEALNAALKEFSAEMNNISANPVFNPKLMTAAFKIGMIHLQRGLNNFADWSKAMINTSEQTKPFLQSVWDSVNAYPKSIKFDENKMSAVMRYVGTQYDKGITNKVELKNNLVKMIGKDYAELIEPAYAGITKFPSKEDIHNELNDSANSVAQRDSKRNDQDRLGKDDESGKSSRGIGEGLSSSDGTGKQGLRNSNGVRRDGSGDSRTISNSAVRSEESSDKSSSAGSEHLPGSISDNFEGQSLIDTGTTGRDIESVKNRRNNDGNLLSKTAKSNTKKSKAGDLEKLKTDLPMLLPEQLNDVAFAEDRLLNTGEPGVLFTNGTGTGKTFTGLGIVKRFVNQGKENILVISPSNEINNAWVKSAEKYFNLPIQVLEDTKDSGKGVTITTYANMGYNNQLVKRKWDLVLTDESQNLMSGEKGNNTHSLDNLRAITYHHNGLNERFHRLHEKEYAKLSELRASKEEFTGQKDKLEAIDKKISDLNRSLEEKKTSAFAKWESIDSKDKPKVVFLSATPWAYVSNIDYAEGYLFNYEKNVDNSGYNSGDGREHFYMQNFGYRMRYNKLTRPDASVNSSVMEIQFHEKLRKEGALSGRALTVDKDYDRGFILVNGGVGNKIDEGFEWLSDKKNGDFGKLLDYLRDKFKGHERMYLLEAIKAREAIPLVKQWVESGKKVVIFHDYKKGGAKHPFKVDISSIPAEIQGQYQTFKAARPDLVNLNLSKLESPISTLQKAFGDKLLVFNGDIDKKVRAQNVKSFNDDNSGKNIILIQSDAGQAGISLHDTTGDHQRVLINLGMPTKPVAAIQIEGRIYRVGQKSNAIFRYLNTGTYMEKSAFANKIAERASTAENLALGSEARDLKNSFIDAFEETIDSNEWRKNLPGAKNEGVGGKEKDQAIRNALSKFDKAKTYYYGQQKKNSKTKASEGNDYFATPEPLGYKMVEWANIKPGESILEPSAGHGAIARFFPADTKNVAIEQSNKLIPRIKMAMDGGEVINNNFEDYYVGNKFNAVVMNPPFGSGGKTAIDHVAKAFKHLRDGGRIVAIIPNGPSSLKHLDKWLYGNPKGESKAEREGEKDAILMKVIDLPGVVFERVGTKVNTKVLIIDKQETAPGKEVANAASTGETQLNNVKNIEEFFDRIENISAPEYQQPGSKDNQVKESTKEAAVIGESKNFDIGEHTDTRNNDTLYKATFKDRVDGNVYKSISSLAKRNDGGYSRFAKAFLFKDESNRNKFVEEADNFMSKDSENKFSAENNKIVKMLNDIEFVAHKDLSSKEAAVQEFSKKFGVPVIFFDGDSSLRGIYKANTEYLNRKANLPLNWVFWHESFHWMKDNNTSLYSDLVEHIKSRADFSSKQLNEYREEIGRPELSDAETIEEMLADYMPDVARRVEIFKSIGQKDQSLAERFMAWISDMMDRFHEFIKTPASGLTNSQKALMREKLAKLASSMLNSNGEKIFTVNGRTKEIKTKQNGKPLSDLLVNSSPVSYSIESKQTSTDNGKDKSDSSISENLKHGLQAMDKVISEGIDVENAMYRDDVGNISFYWGTPGKGAKLKHGYGISHLIARRDSEDGSGIKTARKMVDVIAKGTIKRKYGPGGAERIDIGYDGYTAVLSLYKDGNQENWLLSGWKDYENTKKEVSSANGEGYGSTEATTSKPMRTRQGGADTSFIDNSISQNKNNIQLDKDIKRSDKSAFSSPENKYSADNSEDSFLSNATEKLARKIGIMSTKDPRIEIKNTQKANDEIGLISKVLASPSRIAQKIPAFKMFYEWGSRAMAKQTKLRADFNRKFMASMDLVKNKEDRENLYKILWSGDIEGQEWTRQELIDNGANENVADAYIGIRRLMTKAYRLLNDARRQVQTKSENVSAKKLKELEENKFVEIMKSTEQEDGNYLVTYKEAANWKKTYTADDAALELMEQNDAIQIIDKKPAGYDENGNKLYTVEVRESIADINKRTGYIPHFFHDFFIMTKETDPESEGKFNYKIIDSGRNLKEATAKAEEYLKNHDANIVIQAKQFDFSNVGIDDAKYAATVGDKEYQHMVRSLAKENMIPFSEAKEMLDGKVKQKNRHRFFGNMMQRKGTEGYEKELNWVLRHYFNSTSRYVALETEFKPKAISLFERLYGRFDNEHRGTANYIKDYINDINGNPSNLEESVNNALNKNKIWRSLAVSRFGDRAALQLASSVTNTISVLKLGFFNVSSAMLNLTQLVNSAALIGDVTATWKGIAKISHRKLSMKDKKVLVETGVLDDIGLDSAAGYGKMMIGKLPQASMIFFKKSEELVRRGTVLAAYDKGIKDGMSHQKAIEYAKEVNRKANFDYGVNDAPNVFRRGSIISQVLLQFKKYPIKELELMTEMVSKSTPKKQKALFWGGYFLLAGLLQVPAVDWFDSLLEYFLGDSVKTKIKKSMFEFAGNNPEMKELVKIATYGIGSLANIDISSRTGVGDAIPKVTDPMTWFGATGSTAIQTARNIFKGDTMNALKSFSPGLANIIMAATGKSEGSRDRINSKYDTLYDRILRGAGFKSVHESIGNDVQTIIHQENEDKKTEKQKAIDNYIADPTADNARKLKELRVRPDTVKEERQRKQMDKLERTAGGMSKKDAREYKGLFGFAQ